MADDTQTTTSTGRRRIDVSASAAPAPPAPEPEPEVVAQADPAPPEPTSEVVEAPVDVFALTVKPGPVKMRAPENCSPVTLGDLVLTPDADGLVDVPADLVGVLRSHMFEAV